MISTFTFGGVKTAVHIQENLPSLKNIQSIWAGAPPSPTLFVCDSNTRHIADAARGRDESALCILESGEGAKNWQSVEKILEAAQKCGAGRDALFVAVGGGVMTDITGFAASIYMRGARLAFISTTLLGMVDAALGGKTAIDMFERKNFAGTFYPAQAVYMPVSVLGTLPAAQIKSGLAEIVKTAILDEESDDDIAFEKFYALKNFTTDKSDVLKKKLAKLIAEAVRVKARFVEADPQETGEARVLLNLGHTFAHALESSAGLGKISHGEAVAWGIARACELGLARGKTPKARGEKIRALLGALGYEIAAPHPAMKSLEVFMRSLDDDKKKKAGAFRFVVPAERGAVLIQLNGEKMEEMNLIKNIAAGAGA
ncbi:MAG: 3-dehydroquinate synthase [Spirochaetaceae bacterium]|jgi:3-dehydroquinate synthase|nr:3-dehydroquinate synthase [Spirochaetaceae bacterium]